MENPGKSEIKMYDISGNLLIISHEDKINLPAYPNGIYLQHSGNQVVKVIKRKKNIHNPIK
jgi:hypothetical protein